MADDGGQKEKHAFAISGRVKAAVKKRFRSGEDDIENKRHQRSISGNNLAEEGTSTSSTMPTDTAPDDTVQNLIKALTDVRVQTTLKHTMNEALEVYKQENNERIEAIEQEMLETNDRMSTVEIDVDELKQKEKENNIIISGVDDEKKTKGGIRKLLNEKLQCSVIEDDINYIVKLIKRDEAGKAQETSQVKVVFHEKSVKMRVFKSKNKLKGDDHIWLSDDLTPYRSRLAFLARSAVKEERINQTWVFDGKIFIKITKDSKPRVIKHPQDIPKNTT